MVQWFFSSRLESGGPSRLTGLSFGVLGLLELSDSNSAVWENGPPAALYHGGPVVRVTEPARSALERALASKPLIR